VLRRNLKGIFSWLARHRAGLVLLPWLGVAANAIQAKYNQILMQAVSDALVGAPPYSLGNHIYQFRYDLILGFVVVPAILIVLLRWISWRWVLLMASIAAMVWQIILSAETATYAMANSYATLRTMVMALIWAVQHPKNQFLTLPLFDKIYAVGGIALVALLIALVYAIPVRRKLWWSRAGLVLCAIAFLFCVVAATARSHGPQSSIHREVVASLFEHNDSELMKMSVPELLAMYRVDAGIDDDHLESTYAAKAKGYNVIFVVMESMSAEIFDPSRDGLSDMPNAKRLRQTAFVAPAHFTSYPLTNRASFGIFTSIYSEQAVGIAVGDRGVKLPGMIRSLDDAGYTTGYFGYIWRDEEERDDSMMDALGFDRIEDPQAKADELPAAELMFGGPVLQAAEKDHDALVSLRQSIREWTQKKQKFAAAFFPEVGHDPWRNITKKENPSVLEMGHTLAVYQDGFLGELIDELQKDGAIDNTVIVVTADHGQRTVQDDDGNETLISKGKLDERTMRVPMMIYVPKVLSKTVALPGPTSHIDIEPTILSLLGVPNTSKLQQGTVMWNREIARRRLFLSMKVFGANGYYENGVFYTANQGGVYRTSKLPFTSNALPYDSEEVKQVREIVKRHSALQAALIEHLVNEKP
jgi:phosphoglycerol transferase MdoB-like AlkP superfamily enzyme